MPRQGHAGASTARMHHRPVKTRRVMPQAPRRKSAVLGELAAKTAARPTIT